MREAKLKNRAARKRKSGKSQSGSSQKSNATGEAIAVALAEVQHPPQPRARMRLRAAMRKVGLDEWKIAWLLNFKIHCLAESTHSSDSKLLLDYLKEAARHLDPASPRGAPQENATVELVHDVPRPDRTER